MTESVKCIPMDDSCDIAAPGQHVVYFAYDRDNRLLYVGQTNDLRRRLREHRYRLSVWWQFVTTVRYLSTDSAHAARGVEESMIRVCDPLFNTLGKAAA